METSEFVVALRAGQSTVCYCPQCAVEVHMLSAEQAARVTEVGLGTIDQWVRAGKLHFTELGMGQSLICVNSLAGQAPIQPCEVEPKNAAYNSGTRNQKRDLP